MRAPIRCDAAFHGQRRAARFAAAVAWVMAALSTCAPAHSAPVIGYVDEWSDGTLGGWGGGATYSNPGTGGFLGAGDGFLVMSTPTLGRLAGFSTSTAYTGNWRAAGITRLRVRLNDVNADDPLEMHVMIVSGPDLWIDNTGFAPPENAWAEFTIDLGSAAAFTHVVGTGTFDQAMQSVDRIQIRHDTPPFTQPADLIQADVGIDHVELLGGTVPVATITWGGIKVLHR
jgi:hypothetical protein